MLRERRTERLQRFIDVTGEEEYSERGINASLSTHMPNIVSQVLRFSLLHIKRCCSARAGSLLFVSDMSAFLPERRHRMR